MKDRDKVQYGKKPSEDLLASMFYPSFKTGSAKFLH